MPKSAAGSENEKLAIPTPVGPATDSTRHSEEKNEEVLVSEVVEVFCNSGAKGRFSLR